VVTAIGPVTREEIQQRVATVEASTTLDGNAKGRVLVTYDQALADIQSAEDWRRRAQESIDLRATAPETILDLEQQAALPLGPPATPPNPETTDLNTLSTLLAEAENKLDAAEAVLSQIQSEIGSRSARRTQIESLITEARASIESTRAMTAPAGAPPEEIDALRAFVGARITALEAEITAHNEELASFDIRGRLLSLQEEIAQRDVEAAQRNAIPLREIVAKERLNDAARTLGDAELAQRQAEEAPEPIRSAALEIAAFNLGIAQRRASEDGPQVQLPQIEVEQDHVDSEISRLANERSRIQARESTIGRTEAVGTLLRTYRDKLPNRREISGNLRRYKKSIDAALLEQIELGEARADVSATAFSRRIEEALQAAAADADTTPAQLEQYRSILSSYLSTQRNLLDALIGEHDAYLNALLRLNTAEQKLLKQRDEFADYINQRVLWIASAKIIGVDDFRHTADAMRWLFDWRNWREVVYTLGRDLRDAPIPNALAVVIALIAAIVYPRIRIRLAQLAEQSQRRTATNYWWTLETLAYTLLLTAPLPLLLCYVGLRLGSSLSAGDFAGTVGTSLLVLAGLYATFEFARRALAPKGLGEVHFGWAPEATRAARRALIWAVFAGLPLLFVIAMMENQASPVWRESAGRIAFVVLMVVWALRGHRLTHKNAPSVTIFFPLTIPGKIERVRRVLYLVSAGAPIGFAITALAGYFDTALQLALRVHITLIFIFLVSCGVGLAMRALLLTRRKLAIEQAKKKRDELREAQKKSAEGVDIPSGTDIQEPEIDLAQIDVQTTRLTRSAAIVALSVGIWFVWVDYIPALRVLDEITIRESTAPIRAVAELPMAITANPDTEAAPAAPGDAAAAAAPANPVAAVTPPAAPSEAPGGNIVGAIEALTYADLLLSVIFIWLTISATRNLPGLLEIAVLQRLTLAPGERYAIKTVLGYIIAVIGAIATFNVLGIQWERMQWLVAALGLGIGFGLQEIVANFISGLIILFERPVRLGDTVTVGNVSGTVTRIQIRATTITDWDRKDLIVPNKEFVTGQVVNWSLTDPVIRTTITLGVDYGSDTRQVRDILMRVATMNARVLKEPEPMVVFSEFGASTLNFELRVFVSNVAEVGLCRDELHHAINDALREAGIEIAFNQTDIHIRSVPPSLTLGGTPLPKDVEKQ